MSRIIQWRRDIARHVVRGDVVRVEDTRGTVASARDTTVNGKEAIELVITLSESVRFKGLQAFEELRLYAPENMEILILTDETGGPING